MDWNRAVSEIGPRLYRYFCASFAPEAASDLTQDTLLRLVTKYESAEYDPSKGSLLMYAYGIARLVRLEAWKAKSPEESIDEFSRFAAADDDEKREVARLRACISELNESQEQVVLLLIDEHMKLQEIADVMSLPLNTIKSHIHRAKEILRKKMKEGV